MLARGTAQFWVLRDLEGVGHMVACAPAPMALRFSEVKGPRNTPVSFEHPDLVQLGIALGVRPSPPRRTLGNIPARYLASWDFQLKISSDSAKTRSSSDTAFQ